MTARAPYRLEWKWSHEDEDHPRYFDDVEATTAPRAIEKLHKLLAQEYSFKRNDLLIFAVYRLED